MHTRWLAIALFLGLMSSLVTLGFAEALGFAGRLLARVEATYGGEALRRVEAWSRLIGGIRPAGAEEAATSGGENGEPALFDQPGGVGKSAPPTVATKDASVREKLVLVNAFFNQMRFVSDRQQWGKDDYWATPVEFLAAGGGDCEDFSLAKYFTLRALGVPADSMRLTYAKAVKLNQAHMVVAYFPATDAEPLILDNLVGDIRPASQRVDLVPVYSFNGDGLWLSKERGRGRRVGGADRLKLWNDLKYRMENMSLEPLPTMGDRL